jgi:hypothetical protein
MRLIVNSGSIVNRGGTARVLQFFDMAIGWCEEMPNARRTQTWLWASDNFTAMLNISPLVYECLGKVKFEGTAYLEYQRPVSQHRRHSSEAL